jgi:hypothetical protein
MTPSLQAGNCHSSICGMTIRAFVIRSTTLELYVGWKRPFKHSTILSSIHSLQHGPQLAGWKRPFEHSTIRSLTHSLQHGLQSRLETGIRAFDHLSRVLPPRWGWGSQTSRDTDFLRDAFGVTHPGESDSEHDLSNWPRSEKFGVLVV